MYDSPPLPNPQKNTSDLGIWLKMQCMNYRNQIFQSLKNYFGFRKVLKNVKKISK